MLSLYSAVQCTIKNLKIFFFGGKKVVLQKGKLPRFKSQLCNFPASVYEFPGPPSLRL